MFSRILTHLGSAGLAGLIATVPMTAVMMATRKLFKNTYRPILPDKVTAGTLEQAGVANQVDEKSFDRLSWLGHFSYGAATGALYPYAAKAMRKLPPFSRGPLFGLGVWLASYWGWLPLLGIRPTPKQTAQHYNVMGVVSHIVWGLALVAVYERLERRQRSAVA